MICAFYIYLYFSFLFSNFIFEVAVIFLWHNNTNLCYFMQIESRRRFRILRSWDQDGWVLWSHKNKNFCAALAYICSNIWFYELGFTPIKFYMQISCCRDWMGSGYTSRRGWRQSRCKFAVILSFFFVFLLNSLPIEYVLCMMVL